LHSDRSLRFCESVFRFRVLAIKSSLTPFVRRMSCPDENREHAIRVQPWMKKKPGLTQNPKTSSVEFEKFAKEVETMSDEFMALRRKAGI
jgi:hypothetical protein